MDKDQQQRYFDLGQSYFWLSGKYDFLRIYLSSLDVPQSSRRRVLDCGCGPGNMYALLEEFGQVYGSDFSVPALAFARERGLKRLFIADATAFAVQSNTFDLIVLADVLEHIDDDEKALAELRRILKPGGRLLISVPAFAMLWGAHDEAFGHFRRYSRRELVAKFERAGLEVEDSSYFEALFFVPMFLFRKLKALLPATRDRDDFVPVSRSLNAILRRVIAWEAYIVRRWHPPFGVSLIGVARKATGSDGA
jgi:SAM-dependent methyltransferase